MKRKKKKIMAFLLALTLMVSLMSKDQLFVAAENTQAVENESVEETVIPEESSEETSTSAEESTETVTTESASEETSSVESSSTEESSESEESEETSAEEETKTEEKMEEATTGEMSEETDEIESVTEIETETEGGSYKGSEDDPWEAKADGIKIKAYADKGVLPEDAVMIVSKLSEDSEEYKKSRELVKESGTEFNEMMALDISFEAENDKGEVVEIEPDGTVRVTMELPEIIPANVEEDSLTINHIKENEEGELLEAVPVADKGNDTEGTIEVVDTASEDTQDVKAEFVTESFSVYTITWTVGGQYLKGTINIELQAATRTSGDSEFEGLFGKTSVGSLELGSDQKVVTFPRTEGIDSVTYNNKNYTPTGRAYIECQNGYTEVTNIKLITIQYGYSDYYVVYAEGEGLTEPESSDFKTNPSVLFYGNLWYGSWYDSNYPNSVYLEYNTPLEPGGSTGDVTQDTDVDSLEHRKYIEDNNDGTYDLTLTVSGAAGSSESKKQLDVLVILDQSGSMKYNMAGTNKDDGNQPYNVSRWYNAKMAINELINSLENNTSLDTKYSIVTFSGSKGDRNYTDQKENDAWVKQDWAYASDFTLSEALDPTNRTGYTSGKGVLDFEPSGGTNYQAGLRKGKEQLTKARSAAQKVVIFLSDGEATYYYNGNGITVGAGSADADSVDGWGNATNAGSCSSAAYREAETITNANFFYTIGLGNADKINANVLKNLSAKVETASPGCVTNGGNAPFMCDDLSGLTDAFEKMVGDITRFTCSNVTITDELSDNVYILGTAGTPEEVTDGDFTIKVTDKDGNVVDAPEGIAAYYNTEKRQVILDFPDNYELESGYTYSVTFKVKPSDEAYQKYAQNGGYTDKAGEDTGDNAGEMGFFSNNSAEVTYTYKETKKEESYQNPVVHVDLGKITISKKVEGLPEGTYNDKVYSFKITGLTNTSDYSKYLLKGSTGSVTGDVLQLKNGESATFIYEKGTTLTFAEIGEDIKNGDTVVISGAKVEGYDWTVSVGNQILTETNHYEVTGMLTEEETNLLVINSYVPSNRKLTVKKLVDGNMGNRDEDFTFTLNVKKDGAEYTENIAFIKYGEATEGNQESEIENGALVYDAGKNCYSFVLRHGQSIDLTVPNGCEYTITEDKQNYDVDITIGTEKKNNINTITGSIEKDITITFTNTLNIVTPPTGVMRDVSPYFFMTLTAFAAALWFALTRRRRD